MTEDILKQIRKEYFTKKREIEKLKEKRDRLKALEKCSEVQEYLNLLGCISLINDNQNEILTDDEILYSTYRKYIYKSQHTNNIYVYVGAFKRTSDGDILVSNSPFDYKLYQDVENEFNKVFKDYDLIIGPTTTTLPYKVGESLNDAIKSFMDDILTIPVNMAGLPGMSIPVGFSSTNLPIGMQIIANSFEEAKIYQLGSLIEKELNLNLIPGGDK